MSYTVRAETDGKDWGLTVDELPLVFSQCRRLDQVEEMAREAIALKLNCEPDEFEIEVVLELPSRVEAAVNAAKDAFVASHDAERQLLEAKVQKQQALQALKDLGYPNRDIGSLTGLSHQRVAALLKQSTPLAS